MVYQLLADFVVLIHLGYVLFVIFGQLAILLGVLRRWQWIRNFWFRVVHLAMIAVVVVEAVLGIVCPLTDWEYQLRELGGGTAESGSFVGRLMQDILFVETPPAVLTACYVLFGLVVLASWIWIPPRRRKK